MTRNSVTQLISLLGGLLLATAAPGLAQTDPHAGHQQEKPKPTTQAPPPAQAPRDLPPFIPPLTDEDQPPSRLSRVTPSTTTQ
jgi:hypothetical protein